ERIGVVEIEVTDARLHLDVVVHAAAQADAEPEAVVVDRPTRNVEVRVDPAEVADEVELRLQAPAHSGAERVARRVDAAVVVVRGVLAEREYRLGDQIRAGEGE